MATADNTIKDKPTARMDDYITRGKRFLTALPRNVGESNQ